MENSMSSNGVNTGRRRFITGATCVAGAAGFVGAAVPFIKSWKPSARAKAAGAPVRANIANVEPGQMITVEWRGRPIYVVRRSPEMLESLQKDRDLLRDPDSTVEQQPAYISTETRAMPGHEQYLVIIGLCTHLGCAPHYRPEVGAEDLGGEEWFGGFFCPCHGSKFDLAGRVFKGVPAPLNLEVPPYRFETDTVLVIGEDAEAV
jgi:ubiquinol-cytochrome c reductase iron-sulfur subunit